MNGGLAVCHWSTWFPGIWRTVLGIRHPAASGTNSSVGPPAVAITGSPLAIASSAGMQKPSPR